MWCELHLHKAVRFLEKTERKEDRTERKQGYKGLYNCQQWYKWKLGVGNKVEAEVRTKIKTDTL